jgi:uncharacterized protein (DUF1501 family)
MRRRDFLKIGSLATVPVVIGGIPVQAIGKQYRNTLFDGDNGKILVLIQLNGGNDGLNTVIPLESYDALANHRSNIIIPENELISVNSEFSFHPSLTGLKEIHDQGMLHIVNSVGYPNQNRSHFRSSDIWHSGSSAQEYEQTGWMGRFFGIDHPEYPDGYPDEEHPDPFAITIGALVSDTCQGPIGNYSLAFFDPENLSPLAESSAGNWPEDSCYGMQLKFIGDTIRQTNAYGDQILGAANAGTNLATYPETGLAQQMKTIAQLISGGLQSKVYIVSQGGYDTHANQATVNNPTEGNHANLLQILSDAINAFQQDINLQNLDDKVLGMTYSEFGRQIKSNISIGTDHGTAAPLFLFGSCIQSGMTGEIPNIPIQVNPQEGVPMQYDFRDIYGSVIQQWFGASESMVQELFTHDYQPLSLIDPSCSVSATSPPPTVQIEAKAYPIPFSDVLNIEFESKGHLMKISLYDARGQEVKVLAHNKFPIGLNQITYEGSRLYPGNYYIRIADIAGQRTLLAVKVN